LSPWVIGVGVGKLVLDELNKNVLGTPPLNVLFGFDTHIDYVRVSEFVNFISHRAKHEYSLNMKTCAYKKHL
jgi:hypothetical protein